MDKREMKEDVENMKEGTGKDQAATQEQPQTDEKETAVAEEAEAIAKLKEELESSKDKYIRLYSEFENFRRRTAKEKLDLIQSANEQLLKSLLPVADDFDRALNSVADRSNDDLAGFLLIHAKFKKILELYGVKTMDAGQGSDFNADLHEAISQVQAPTAELKGKIIDVVEKGYLLNDKVIRYAKVVVGN
jgi:molecular chaperone GrpE